MAVKYLIQNGTDILTYTTQWEDVGDTPVTKAMFDSFGMNDLSKMTRNSKDFTYTVTTSTNLDGGKVFTQIIDLNKMNEITSIKF